MIDEDKEQLIEFFHSMDAETNKIFTHFLTQPSKRVELFMEEDSDKIIVLMDNKIVGFAFLAKHPDYPGVPSLGLVVRSQYRNKGVGSALMDILFEIKKEKGYKKIYLSVYKINVKAFNFYKKRGFVVIGEDSERWRMEHE